MLFFLFLYLCLLQMLLSALGTSTTAQTVVIAHCLLLVKGQKKDALVDFSLVLGPATHTLFMLLDIVLR